MEFSAHLHIAAVLPLQTIPGTPSIGGWTRKSVSMLMCKEQDRYGPQGETIPARSRNHCCHETQQLVLTALLRYIRHCQ